MNTRQLLKESGIELKSSGFATYSEYVTLDEFQKLCDNVRRDEMNMTIANILDLLRTMDEKENGRHNYYGYVANIIEQQFGDNDETC
jgi:hypothetical protein